MIVTTSQLFRLAYGRYAVGAYNINNAEQAVGLFRGHTDAQAPFIVQISKGARKYIGTPMIESIIRGAEKMYPKVIFAVHLDHGDEATCYDCINSGFYSSVMIDASHHPFAENVAVTKRVVEKAHAKGLSVEAELGMLGGVEEDIKLDEKNAMLTDPAEAKEFVKESGCDSLAVAIGTSHGAYKFSKKPDGSVLKMDVLIQIHKRLPKTHLVMHGSSSVPKELQDIINEYGGKLKPTWGVPVEEIQLGIRNGVRKVNVDTDNRLAMTGAIRKVFFETPEKFDPRDYLKPAREAMKKVVAERMTQFGQAGHVGDYSPIPLAEMARRYAAAKA
jgi:fructose-bisphosphate aldolase class II